MAAISGVFLNFNTYSLHGPINLLCKSVLFMILNKHTRISDDNKMTFEHRDLHFEMQDNKYLIKKDYIVHFL